LEGGSTVLALADFVVARGKCLGLAAVGLDACVGGGLEMSVRAAGTFGRATADCTSPLVALGKLVVVVVAVVEVAIGAFASESFRDSFEESALVFDD